MSKAIETIIRKRIAKDGGKFFCNDNISKYIQNESELYWIERDVEMKVEELLQCLIIDTENDHNTQETSKRMAKMFIHEIFRGRYREQPKITTFPNATNYDQLYITGPISIRSTWIAERPQIQEEMTMQIADAVEEVTGADGVAIVIRAEHMCMTHRGVKEHESDMTTSVMRGSFRNDPELKKEFLTLMQEMR